MNRKPLKLYLFYCANSLDSTAFRQDCAVMGAKDITMVSLPCSGKVNLLYLLKAFEKGADGVILVTCGGGDCKFIEGNLRAKKRSEAVEALLEEIGFGKDRMRIVQKNNDNGVQQVVDELHRLSESIRNQS
jgi:coenzyme F420-reducing hydrogenase delta subunit